MFNRIIVIVVALTGFALAGAGGSRAVEDGGRFVLKQVDGGFVRLDKVNGSVSECRREGSGWACRSAADDRDAYRAEITRLEEKNRQLELKVKTLEAKLAKKEEGVRLRLPNDSEVNQVMDFFSRMMRKLMDMARDIETATSQRT